MRIGIIVSRFNESVTSALLEGALSQAKKRGIAADAIEVFQVPGAVEIPLIAQCLAKQGKVDAIVALGAVIRGETTHYDYVCEQVSQGCQRVSLDHHIPVIFGVLTTENDEQAMARLDKGAEAIDVAIEMITVVRGIK